MIANTGSVISLVASANLSGGTITTAGTGIFRVNAGDTGYIHDLTNSGNLRVANGADLYLYGAIVNNGTITLDTGANGTRLLTNGDLTFSGTGSINMPTGGSIGNGSTVTFGSGQTFSGQGNLGTGNSAIVNNGLVQANVSGATLTLDPANAGVSAFDNNATLKATAGGILSLTGSGGGAFDNTGGIISAENASQVSLVGSVTVVSGTLTSAGTGVIRVPTGETAYVHDVTNTANVRVTNNADLYLYGSVVNNGSITLEAGANSTRILTNGDLNFSGTGTINLPTGGSIGNGSFITFGSGQTVSGQGNIGTNNSGIVNNGLIQANVSGATLTLDPYNAAGSFDNNTTIKATNGGILSLTGSGGGTFDNTGATILADVGSQVQLSASVRIGNGTITSNGTGKVVLVPSDAAYLDTVTSTADVHISNNSDLYISGTFTNNNAVTLDAGANTTRLRTQGADVTIAGTGTINMPTGGNIDGGARVTIVSTQTIKGQGNIGANNTIFTSAALIDANVNGATLTIDPANAASAFVNTGTLRASNGGILSLTGSGAGDFTNTGATITATGTNSQVQFTTSSRVIGGTVSATSGGTIAEVPGQVAYLQNVTLATGTTYTIGNNADTYIEGSLVNNGTITFAPTAANLGRVRTNGADISISGTGSIVLDDNNFAGSSIGIDGGAIVTLGSGQLIHGSGYLGANNTLFVNNGIVDADRSAGGISIDPANAAVGFTNNNIIRATAGGKLYLTGSGAGAFNNAATASILATGAGSEVQLTTSVQITGGNLTTTSGGLARLLPGQVGYLSGVTFSGALRVEANADLYLNGTLTNNGTITLAPTVGGNNSVRLRTDGTDRSILGTGTIVLANGPTVDAALDGGGRFTIGAGQTITGSGSLGYNNTLFTNNGTIVSDHGGIGIDPANAGPTSFLNNGTLRATTGGSIVLTGSGSGSFSGAGTVLVDASSFITATTSASVDFTNSITGAGTFEATNSSDVTATSYLVSTLKSNTSATARIRSGGGNAGTSKVNTLTIDTATSGRLDVTDHGLIVDYATAGNSPRLTIRGYLTSGRNGGAWNGAGIDSSFANNNGKGVGYGEASDIYVTPTSFLGQSIDSTSVLIRYTYLGDTNLDGAVNFDDLLKLAQNYNTASKVWTTGDFTYDGLCNFDDLLALAQNYNLSLLSASQESTLGSDFMADYALAQSLVPEPASLSVLLGLTILGRRRRTDSSHH